jgi:two-component system chemotaxis response regulator CheB
MPVNHVRAVEEVAADITFAARDNWLHGCRFLSQRQHERDKGNLFSRDERNFLRHCSNNKFAGRSCRQMFDHSLQCGINRGLPSCLLHVVVSGGTIQCRLRSRRQMNRTIVIAGSAVALIPLRRILAAMPVPCAASLFVVMHIGRSRSALPALLDRTSNLPASFAKNGDPIEAGRIYVAPPDHHMILERDQIRLTGDRKVNGTRPATDPLFISAANAHGSRVIGIVLSGGDGDGADGLRAISQHGGTALVHDPREAAMPYMPRSAIAAHHPDACLASHELANRVAALCAETEKSKATA